jgi:hypothetical protein
MKMTNHKKEYDAGKLETTDGAIPVHFGSPAPNPTLDENGQHKSYWVLSESERAKGFIRPVRRTYVHEKCGGATTMGQALAETYAREPGFYGATMCVHCRTHFPVGEFGEFVWDDLPGHIGEKVGT